MTQPRSSSTNVLTYSTMAFGAANCCVNSPTHSPTAMVMMLMTTTEMIRPAGPESSSASPLLMKMPLPMTVLMTMNYVPRRGDVSMAR
jgi:hypothetical protein